MNFQFVHLLNLCLDKAILLMQKIFIINKKIIKVPKLI